MREIIFKGFSKDLNIWVHGYYYQDPEDGHFIMHFEYIPVSGSLDEPPSGYFTRVVIEVYPESICQITGLKDKYGKDIYFDCDIIKIPNYEYTERWGAGYKSHKSDLIFIVEENFFGNKIKILSPSNCDTTSIDVLFNLNKSYSHLNYPSKMEVIGNIYENPELLK